MPQPLTKAGIANMALSLIGQKPIPTADTTWTTTKEATQVAAVWETCRLVALRAVNWNFARVRAALVTEAVETLTGWDYIWDYPSDKHYIRKVFVDTTSANPDPVEYLPFYGTATEAYYLATKEAACYYEGTDTSVGTTHDHYLLYDPIFSMSLACLVASLIAKPLTGKESETTRMSNMYDRFIDRAVLQNAREGKVTSTLKNESEFITSRG
jgi:hypothetical protein